MIYSEYGVRTCFETSRFAYACSREPWLLTATTGVHKTAQKGRSFLVYPLGFEPKLDGVGGRYVIQLHYEYV